MQTSDSTNQPFGNGFPLKFVTRQQCTDIFGPNFNSQLVEKAVNWTNIQYGGLDLVLNRTVFVSGSIDPWSALGMTTSKNGNLAIFIKGRIIINCQLLFINKCNLYNTYRNF